MNASEAQEHKAKVWALGTSGLGHYKSRLEHLCVPAPGTALRPTLCVVSHEFCCMRKIEEHPPSLVSFTPYSSSPSHS